MPLRRRRSPKSVQAHTCLHHVRALAQAETRDAFIEQSNLGGKLLAHT